MRLRLRASWILFVSLLFIIAVLSFLKGSPEWVESVFSQSWYPLFNGFQKLLFGYIPFSIGDLLYGGVIVALLWLIFVLVKSLVYKKRRRALQIGFHLLNAILALYAFFYISWGLNYYRQPLALNAHIELTNPRLADYLVILERMVDSVNTLRTQTDPVRWKDKGSRIAQDMMQWVQQDTTFENFLSRSNVVAKSPLNSTFVSYVGVSGYFNPFSHETQINDIMPAVSKPFTYIHELAHQQGVGFEDEANFIAFVRLKRHPEVFYRYSAYLQTVSYLIMELYRIDQNLYHIYRNRLSAAVLSDLKEERLFWAEYLGWMNRLTSLFYNEYLQHNNQAEGMDRYNRMVRLVLAYELKIGKCKSR